MLDEMWAEIIATREDFQRLLQQAFPLTIRLGDPGSDHSLVLSDLSTVELVPDLGLRVECRARVHWPVLGIEVPVTLRSLTIVLLPSVGRSAEGGDTLVFRVSIERADFSALPSMIDGRVTDAINARLADRNAELEWNFSKALTHTAALPELLEPLDRFAVHPAWGKVRVTEEAVVYAISLHTAIVRRGEPIPTEFDPSHAPRTRPPVSPHALARLNGSPAASQLATVGLFGLGVGAAFFALKATFDSRS
jgi:hypothetical protein